MENSLIPNGSIVLLNGGNITLMIYGRKQVLVAEDEQDGKMYDYLAVPYPEGYISPEYTYVFNHTDIAKILFKGFINEEEEEFQTVLNNA
ncbi:DUF4176 domain-containing protein [Peribacillus cavernae]|uniref:DUF4176 domain-containing protein n=1 Tax=Peribacillus cavernae TaxID=1674310 RepID=A0A3S0TWZ4_9BACI|nr:DUF4176 domain-containing protein [Peribacillus cavernae]MDQ0221246.1 hypothetical protein [Peribacillus cavernae]RUQ25123.1 DUF4176 domain-containing protein [Peribacillus cavernae]